MTDSLKDSFGLPKEPQKHPNPPFMAVYEKGGKKLIFLAARHERDMGSPTFRLIDDLFARFHPDAVVIEACSNEGEKSPAGYAADVRNHQKISFSQVGEPAYAAWKAMENGADFILAEPPDRLVVGDVLSRGFTVEDLVASYLYLDIRGLLLNKKDIDEDFMDRQAQQYGQRYGLEGGYSFDRFRAWYAEKIGVPYSGEDIRNYDFWPCKRPGSRIVEDIHDEEIRDPHIASVIKKYFAEEGIKTLAVVYGAKPF